MGSSLDLPLPGVLGERSAKRIQRALGLTTAGELLEHYPRRYARRGELTDLGHLVVGDTATIVAEVVSATSRPMRGRRGTIVEVVITDGRGRMPLTFFNQAWRLEALKPGVRGTFSGKVTRFQHQVQLTHPDYELFDLEELDATTAEAWAMKPIPIYPATASCPSWVIQAAIGAVLDALPELPDPLPEAILQGRTGEHQQAARKGSGEQSGAQSPHILLGYRDALERIHRPTHGAEIEAARDSLRYREAFLLQLALLERRFVLGSTPTTPRVPKPEGLLERFDAALPFALTGDQRSVGETILEELARPHPMNRLLQGEVGSGKTLVALRAMLAVADSGGQAALLAPTEVLAAQHLRSIVHALGPELAAELRPTLVTGSLPTAERRKATLAAASGQARIVVGTHALLGEQTQFFDLGLVVVDEQHRFGVDQRDALRAKGRRPPHTLVLTATPIPRTVAMTVFGDLDVSTMRELPAGRQSIESFVVPLAEKPGWAGRIWTRVAEEIGAGRQAFVVCPAIARDDDGSADDGIPALPDADVPGVDSAGNGGPEDAGAEPARPLTTVAGIVELIETVPELAAARVAPLHGRLGAEEKDETMRAFAAGSLDLLVATTVIEVGVDVPNASTMVVLDAERFGVSQLHQLRGRVGRGGHPGLCLLVTHAEPGTLARERVDAVASTLDGFELAQKDLELRREGDVLGSAQSGGRSRLKLLRVATDGELIAETREAADALLAGDPILARYPLLREALDRQVDESARSFLAKS